MSKKRSADVGESLFGAMILGLGLFIGIQNSMAGSAPGYVAVGPKVFPYLIAAGLVGVGITTLVSALSAKAREDREELDWLPVGLIALGLAVQIALLSVLGWVPAATVLFIFAARAFGSASWPRDIGIGVGLSVTTFAIFNFALGLNLPWGSLLDSMLPK